jgi:hypothetical protein
VGSSSDRGPTNALGAGSVALDPPRQRDLLGPKGTERGQVRGPRARLLAVAALVFVLLCLMPPDGVLSDNEETYFQLAAQSVSTVPVSPHTALFDSSHHRFVADHLLGWLIGLTGFAGAQIVARGLAALAYAATLLALCRRLGLTALDAVLAVVVFAWLGQTLFGGEWMFKGVEAKVAAYPCVLAGLAMVLAGKRLFGTALVFAAATYFHFLVGIFWFFAAMALSLMNAHQGLRRVAAATALFLLLAAPLLGVIGWTQFLDDTAAAAGTPSVDVIYSIIRAPHHTSPFLAGGRFLPNGLSDYLMAGSLLLGALVVARLTKSVRLKKFALWLALLVAYLFLALGLAYVDRDTGVLGKFYLFRPASLVLLLWLLLAIAALDGLGRRWRLAVKLAVVVLMVPMFLLDAANRIGGDRAWQAAYAAEKRGLADFLARDAAAHAVVLVDPELESSFLDLERRTLHPMLVAWKFDPTSPADIREWYRRMEFRAALFASGCGGKSDYAVDFLLTTRERAALLTPSCGPVVYASGSVALLRRGG